MLKQSVKGVRSKSVSVVASDGDIAKLTPLLAGKVEKYKLVGDGGVALAAVPSPKNKKSFIVGSKSATGRLSTMVTIPHIKNGSHFGELSADMKGKFDCGYADNVKCDYVKLRFDA